MSTVEELRGGIARARAALRAAIPRVEEQWESPILDSEDEDEEAWSPRTMVQHTMVIELVYSAVLTGALSRDGTTMREALDAIPDGWIEKFGELGLPQMSLRSSADAVAAIDEQGPRVDSLLQSVTEGDLDLPADLWDGHIAALDAVGYESSRTVRGLLALCLWHNEVHAQQLAEAPLG